MQSEIQKTYLRETPECGGIMPIGKTKGLFGNFLFHHRKIQITQLVI